MSWVPGCLPGLGHLKGGGSMKRIMTVLVVIAILLVSLVTEFPAVSGEPQGAGKAPIINPQSEAGDGKPATIEAQGEGKPASIEAQPEGDKPQGAKIEAGPETKATPCVGATIQPQEEETVGEAPKGTTTVHMKDQRQADLDALKREDERRYFAGSSGAPSGTPPPPAAPQTMRPTTTPSPAQAPVDLNRYTRTFLGPKGARGPDGIVSASFVDARIRRAIGPLITDIEKLKKSIEGIKTEFEGPKKVLRTLTNFNETKEDSDMIGWILAIILAITVGVLIYMLMKKAPAPKPDPKTDPTTPTPPTPAASTIDIDALAESVATKLASKRPDDGTLVAARIGSRRLAEAEPSAPEAGGESEVSGFRFTGIDGLSVSGSSWKPKRDHKEKENKFETELRELQMEFAVAKAYAAGLTAGKTSSPTTSLPASAASTGSSHDPRTSERKCRKCGKPSGRFNYCEACHEAEKTAGGDTGKKKDKDDKKADADAAADDALKAAADAAKAKKAADDALKAGT